MARRPSPVRSPSPLRPASLAAVTVLALVVGVPDPAAAQFERFVDGITETMKPGAGAASSRCARFLSAGFDVETVTRSAAGASWAEMSAGVRQRMTTAVRQRLQRECAARASDTPGGDVAVVKSRATGSGASLTLRLSHADGRAEQIAFHLRSGGAWGWTAVDLIGEGRSVVGSLREEFQGSLAATGDVDRAIEAISR